MRVELTDDPAAFQDLAWHAVVDAAPEGTFFHTPAYLKVWWEEFGAGSLMLAFVMDGQETVGTCAFESIEGRLQFLGGFDVTDYMGPVSLPGMERAVASELIGAVARSPWTEADLRGLPEGSVWLTALTEAAAGRGLTAHRGTDGVAPLIELTGSFGAYLAALPTKLRHEIERKERRLSDEAGGYRIALSTADSVGEDLDRFMDLHRSSPGPKGRFMRAGMEIFFRRLGEAFLNRHQFHLAFIELDGQKAAGAIGLAYGNTFSLYNSAFDRRWGRLSPGMVLVAELIREAADRGRLRFDMLKGDLEYKYRFGAIPREIGRLVLRRS
jgi:CelD/BcsL family acetyltransferase involved in cellulose biosynthesis